MRDKSYVIYIICSVICFLIYTVSMIFVESASILAAVGMLGMWGMMYCINKLLERTP